MTDGVEHAAHLAIPALENCKLNLCAFRAFFFAAECPAALHILCGPRFSIFQLNAACNQLKSFVTGSSRHLHGICLADLVAGMGELVEEVAVVGEENQTFAVHIQAADGAQQRLGLQIDQACHRFCAMRIRYCANNATRLVQRNIIPPVQFRQRPSVDDDLIEICLDFRAEFRNDSAVDGHPPSRYQLLALPPRGDPGCRHDFL